ncbi:MAG TPA: IPT/TIG domain-containing protein [Candidatus Sulfopaludibacter sp.]|jgi:hypothetical protein|nr:IPT/TIG domain-containing protein [Candidatus Sulfopaludibacter sp.]
MKCISVFLLGAVALYSADFTNGQAARLVIGQQSFTAADPNSTNTVLGGVSGIAYAADTLFVADANRIGADPSNHRVLIFPNLSGQLPRPTDELQYNSSCPICVGTASVVLGQPDFTTTAEHLQANATSMRLPTAVASDGVRLVVADTNHNRVLIWNKIPQTNNTPADVVVGQPDFTSSSVATNHVPSSTTMSGPQGVWIQNGKLYIADTGYNRILIYNQIPIKNGAAADVVLGQPNFTTYVEVDVTQQNQSATATNMLNPVSVTSDGTHMLVTDLGFNRVLIWNSIPSSNGQAADVVVGQPDMVSGYPNYAFKSSDAVVTATSYEVPVLCTVSNGTDANSNPTYPDSCNATLNFPRFALSDGKRLFIADGGNDRVLEFMTIPTTNGASADAVLGQIGGSVDQATDAADSVNTPVSLAFDGTNLYVSDPYNRRILVYSVAPVILPYQAVVNSANQNVYATGGIVIGGTINNGDIVTITINGVNYTYTVKTTDSIATVITSLVNAINANDGDPTVTALADIIDQRVALQAKAPGTAGDNVTYSAAVSTSALISASAAGASLSGGGDAAKVAPGTIVTINGTNLAAGTAAADLSQPSLPTQLGGVEVYFNGIRSPLVFVSPTQINAQLPWEFTDTTSVNAYVRSVMSDGSISVTSPVAVSIVPANPAIFAQPGTSNPEIGIVLHGNSHSVGIVSVDGSIVANDVATISVQDRNYSYTVQATDTLDTVRDALIALLNQDPAVSATPAGVFDRIILQARQAGPDGNSIAYTGSSSSVSTGTGSVIITPFGPNLCCANVKGTPVTTDNPALPGETVIVYATGVGLPVLTGGNQSLVTTGQAYPAGGPVTAPAVAMNAIAGGSTADVLQATLKPGSVGLFEVLLHLNAGLTTNQYSSLTIAQDIYVSNVVTVPIFNPNN